MLNIKFFFKFVIFFMSFIYFPSRGGARAGAGAAGSRLRLRGRWTGSGTGNLTAAAAASARRGYDSDFNSFMKNQFSEYPVPTAIKEQKKGPNVGYRPYWYAYSFALGDLSSQHIKQDSDHEDWDYGMGGGSGQGVWGGGTKTLLGAGASDIVGTGALLDRDIDPDLGDAAGQTGPKCFANLGPTCSIGQPAEYYDSTYLELLRQKTLDCDKCSDVSKTVGIVCTVDSSGTLYREMDLCVMEKNNCLEGMAYIVSTQYTFSQYPVAMAPRWGRLSVMGSWNAQFKLYNTLPFETSYSYWISFYRWPYMHFSYMYKDNSNWAAWMKLWFAPMQWWKWTEYTIVWNPSTGWFLMSQARKWDWQDHFYVEYWDYAPWDLLYLDVSTGPSEYEIRFMLHDLTMIHSGRCIPDGPKNLYPENSAEAEMRVKAVDETYQKRAYRLQADGVYYADWDKEDGSYEEY